MSKDQVGINEIQRRDFLRAGLRFGTAATALAAGYAAVPDAFARAVYAAKMENVKNDNILVMIQLAGGNDSLRTVIPIQDGRLHDLRPILAAASVPMALPLNASFGLNQSMTGIKALYDQGKVAIVQGVGYSNPSFSHFESIRVWETADPSMRQVEGWLGKTLSENYDSMGHPLTACACGTTDIPGTLRDLHATVSVIDDSRTFGFTGGSRIQNMAGTIWKGTPGIYGALFDTAIATVEQSIASVRAAVSKQSNTIQGADNAKLVYPSKNELGAALQLAAGLINSGSGAKLLHVTLGGFDTHQTELSRHNDLMAYLDQSVSAFYQDLANHGNADKVLIATWSEFSRRPQENASGGTDHGAAAAMLLIGNPVQGGMYGQAPNLSQLDGSGNIKYGVDFRSVYQEILNSHLGADAKAILGQTFDRVPFLKAAAGVAAAAVS
jgi:uncharacterized protein (DUF1501 family)